MKYLAENSIYRLIIYHRYLRSLKKDSWIISSKLAKVLGVESSQIRKDLALVRIKGLTGKGYPVEQSLRKLEHYLGLTRKWNIIPCGAGNLGKALFHYKGFNALGFRIAAIIDKDPRKIGLRWNKISISPPEQLEALVKKQSIEIAVITVPQEEARGVKEKLEEAGIRSILNFAPYYLSLKNGIVRNVELTTELTFLSTHLNLHGRKK